MIGKGVFSINSGVINAIAKCNGNNVGVSAETSGVIPFWPPRKFIRIGIEGAKSVAVAGLVKGAEPSLLNITKTRDIDSVARLLGVDRFEGELPSTSQNKVSALVFNFLEMSV